MQQRSSLTKLFLVLFVLAMVPVLSPATAFGAARIVIVNLDGPGEGFNDPTPAEPVSGNPGRTIGEQRLIAFQFAADIWGATLDTNAEIRVEANFDPLPCTANSGTLGAAGPNLVFRNFPGSEFFNTWYHSALADKRANRDLAPEDNDIGATFNSNLGQPGCLEGGGFYYGLDTSEPPGQFNLVVVLLHEFAHGLGFSEFVNKRTGAKFLGADDIYMRNLRDNQLNKSWPEMTNAERATSAVNTGNVVWTGQNVTAAAPSVLRPGTPVLTVNAPENIARSYPANIATFGAPVTTAGTTGNVVLSNDGEGVTTDACQPLVNAEAVSGNIALVDRGQCTFVDKVRNAQAAGATGVIIANNIPGDSPAPTGEAPDITIPILTITLGDSNTLKAALAAGSTVNATFRLDPALLAGADATNRVQMYAPNPLEQGSSISHWTNRATPNQLMEPAINSDLTLSIRPPEDLTLPQMRDIGWFQDANGDGLPDGVDTSQAVFRLTSTITCDTQTGEYVARITLTNRGTSTVNNVLIDEATLGNAVSSTIAGSFVLSFGTIAPGASVSGTLRFPASAGAPGSRVPLVVYGIETTTFQGGSFSAGTTRVLPNCTQ